MWVRHISGGRSEVASVNKKFYMLLFSMSLCRADLHCPPCHEASGEGGRPQRFLGLWEFRFPKPPNPKTASLFSGLWARRRACSAKNTDFRVKNQYHMTKQSLSLLLFFVIFIPKPFFSSTLLSRTVLLNKNRAA